MIALILLNKTSWHLSVWCNWKYCYTYSLHQHLTSFPTAKFVFTKVPPPNHANPLWKSYPHLPWENVSQWAIWQCHSELCLAIGSWVNWFRMNASQSSIELNSDNCNSCDLNSPGWKVPSFQFRSSESKSGWSCLLTLWWEGGHTSWLSGHCPLLALTCSQPQFLFSNWGCWCHPGGVWGTLVGTGHGQSGGCVRKTSTKSFSFCYVFGSFGGFSLGQLYISSTSQLLFGSQVWGVQVGLVWGTEGVATRP